MKKEYTVEVEVCLIGKFEMGLLILFLNPKTRKWEVILDQAPTNEEMYDSWMRAL
jgi:hypothetical protein